jgi:hypothetical protein
LLTLASTVAVVDAQEEPRADVATTCAVATAARKLALRFATEGAEFNKLLAKAQENAALREDLAKTTALLGTLVRKVAAFEEAESRHVPGYARPTHALAAARGRAAGAAIVAISVFEC